MKIYKFVLTFYSQARHIRNALPKFDFRRDHQKKSYERREYQSVDEKSLS